MKASPLLISTTIITFSILGMTSLTNQVVYSTELSIPPLLEYSMINGIKTFQLNAQENTHKFSRTSTTTTLSYGNMSYLGPTIRVNNNERINIKVHNQLNVSTTLHQHGLHLPAAADGNTHHIIEPNETWTSSYTIDQRAGTFWYHPHRHLTTGIQVVLGLAGMMIIDDPEASALPIPKTYGVDDIPLIIQDKRFNKDSIVYQDINGNTSRFRGFRTTGMHNIINGNIGKTLLVNGTKSPTFTAKKSLLRLRLLNASSFAIHRYKFKDNRKFYLIANDAGLLSNPVSLTTIELAPSERREILVDISDLKPKEKLAFLANIHGSYTDTALTIIGSNFETTTTRIPNTLVALEKIVVNANTPRREFDLESFGRNGMLTINGSSFNPNRVNEQVSIDTTEIWVIRNIKAGGGMMGSIMHSFHPHYGSFQILSQNGKVPPPELRGWKDTVLLYPGDTVEFAMRFENYTGKYLYHCHQLEHEDAGMMGVFEIVD